MINPRLLLPVFVLVVFPDDISVAQAEELVEEMVIKGYRDDSPDIGRNSLRPKELPRSVQIISDELIEAVQPYAIEDVLTLASNTAFLGDNDGRENSFVMRGFQGTPVLRDGFRVESFGGVTDPELFNIERMEILKGPDSILYGESNPGGLVNLVAKRPLQENHGSVSVAASSYNSIEPRVDLGGGSERVRFRILGLYSQDDGWRDYDNENERLFIAPSVRLQIGEASELTLIAEITEDDYQADFGTAIDLDGDLIADPEQVNNHPVDTIDRHHHMYGFDLEHRFNDVWSAGARLRVIDSGYDYSALFLPFGLDQDTLFYFRVPAQQEQANEETALQINVAGDFQIGGMRNRLFAGFDYRESETENQTRFNPGAPSFLDWRNPDYSELPPAEADIPIADGFYSNEDIERRGFFVQNHLSVTDALTLSAGLRYDDFDRDPKTGSSTSPQDDSETSFQAGAVYAFTDAVSGFVSYSESFAPNFDLDVNNQVLPPETGEGFEVGIKADLFGGGLALTAAVFDITKQNVSTADPNAQATDPNPFGSIANGEQESRGFEVDFSGQLSQRWQAFGSYGYTDSEITKSNNGDEGLPVVGAPEHTAALWLSYAFSGAMDGLVFSFGVQHVGERLVLGDPDGNGDNSDKVELDSHTLLNAAVNYARNNWEFALNLNNITDEEYVDAAWGGLSRSVHAGAPFEAAATVTYNFDVN